MRTTKILFIAAITSTLTLAACYSPESEPVADLDQALERGVPTPPAVPTTMTATCKGAYNANCTCPAGFIPGPGMCVKDQNPDGTYDECYTDADCVTAQVDPTACWAWKCVTVPYLGGYKGCTTQTLPANTACTPKIGSNPPVSGKCNSQGECL